MAIREEEGRRWEDRKRKREIKERAGHTWEMAARLSPAGKWEGMGNRESNTGLVRWCWCRSRREIGPGSDYCSQLSTSPKILLAETHHFSHLLPNFSTWGFKSSTGGSSHPPPAAAVASLLAPGLLLRRLVRPSPAPYLASSAAVTKNRTLLSILFVLIN